MKFHFLVLIISRINKIKWKEILILCFSLNERARISRICVIIVNTLFFLHLLSCIFKNWHVIKPSRKLDCLIPLPSPLFRCQISSKAVFVSRKLVSGKSLFKLSCLFVIRKVGQRKTLSNQRKIRLDFQESIFLLFWAENTFRKLWKIYKYHIICWLYQIWSSNFWLLYIFYFEYLFFNFIP
jgi:hypothetical protein